MRTRPARLPPSRSVTAKPPRWAFCRQAEEQNLRVFRPVGGKGAPHSWHRLVWGAWLDLEQAAHNLNPRLSNTAPQPAHFVYWPRGPNLRLSEKGSSSRAACSRVMIGAGSSALSGRPQVSTTHSRSLCRMSSGENSAIVRRRLRKYSATAAGDGGSTAGLIILGGSFRRDFGQQFRADLGIGLLNAADEVL
jgi:hypothetical protein